MNVFLNPDGTINFEILSDTRLNFEENFAKKQLGTVIKDIIVKSTPSNTSSGDIFETDSIKSILKSSITEIANAAYENKLLNNASFVGSAANTVKEYAGMEADYRMDKAIAILKSGVDQNEAEAKINTLFSVESFIGKEIKDRFVSEMNIKYGTEAEEIVVEIGKTVGKAISDAEEKNIIIGETIKVIADEKEKMKDALEVADEEEPEEDDAPEDNTNDESDLDGTETDFDNDEEEPEEDETSTEDYEFGQERLIGLELDERTEALKMIEAEAPKIIKSMKDFYSKVDKNVKKLQDKDDDLKIKSYFDNSSDFDKYIEGKIKSTMTALRKNKGLFGNSREVLKIKLYNTRSVKKSNEIIAILSALFFNLAGGILGIIIINEDENYKRSKKVLKEIGDTANSIGICEVKLKNGKSDGQYRTVDVVVKLTFNLKKLYKRGSFEDAEIVQLEDTLKDNLNSEIDAGVVTIGVPDMNSDNNDLDIEVTDVEKVVEEQTGAEEYRKYLYGNINIGKSIVPLSPTKLDNLEVPSKHALAAVFAKSTESIDNLRNHLTARFAILSDIVKNENDTELSDKYTDYYKTSMEAFDQAEVILKSLNDCGLTPFGVEDKDDISSLIIASKLYKDANGALKLKNAEPKREFKSFEDAIDAVFDIGLIKQSLKKTGSTEDLNDLTSREGLFWENLYKLEDDDEKKNAIKNVMNLQDLQISPKVLVTDEFYNSLKIAVEGSSIRATGTATPSEANEKLYNNAKERIGAILNKDIDPDQDEIIKAIISNRDPVDYIPTPFEKFIIKIGKDKNGTIVNGKGKDGDFELGNESVDIYNKAILLQVLHTFVDKTKPFDEQSTEDFNTYLFGSKYGFEGLI